MIERAVVDASPLILLSRVQRLDLLRSVAEVVQVTDAVTQEVGAKGAGDVAAVALASADWLVRIHVGGIPPSVAAWQLGRGEASVLAAALAVPPSVAILDDREGRRCAAALGVPVFGTIGIVLRARRADVLPAARPLLEQLRDAGMYIRPQILASALAQVGE